MGVKLDTIDVVEADEYRKNVYDLGGYLLDRFLKPWVHNETVYSFTTLKMGMDRALKPMHTFTKNLITKRRTTNTFEREPEANNNM